MITSHADEARPFYITNSTKPEVPGIVIQSNTEGLKYGLTTGGGLALSLVIRLLEWQIHHSDPAYKRNVDITVYQKIIHSALD